jgi:hypothetical protein
MMATQTTHQEGQQPAQAGCTIHEHQISRTAIQPSNRFNASRAASARASPPPDPAQTLRAISNHSQKFAEAFSSTGSARRSRHCCAARRS